MNWEAIWNEMNWLSIAIVVVAVSLLIFGRKDTDSSSSGGADWFSDGGDCGD